MLFSDIEKEKLLSATISGPRNSASTDILKIAIRPVIIKGRFAYQVTEHYAQKAMHRNISAQDCVKYVQESLLKYKQGVFSTETTNYHALVGKDGEISMIKKQVKNTPSLIVHNREKNYLLQEGTPIPFLIHLGVMTKEGRIIPKKYDKFRQINRFLEMVSDVVEQIKKKTGVVNIIDFGCGKAYLTFALYHYLFTIEQMDVNIVGLDLKADVISDCQRLAETLGFKGLSFAVGEIKNYEEKKDVDLVICLHACNTATDAALDKAIKWNTKVILCVPCCQHELYSQVQNDDLSSLLRYGIFKERFAALVTDAARAELLTIAGYDVQVLEFIDMEHTPKNILIRAIKTASGKNQKQAQERYQAFKKALHINPSLDKSF